MTTAFFKAKIFKEQKDEIHLLIVCRFITVSVTGIIINQLEVILFAMSFKIYLTIITAGFESILAGGIIFGWSSIDYVLTNEGYFNSSCNISIAASDKINSTIYICPSQQYNLELIYTLAAVFAMSFNIVGGVILDYLGSWAVRSMACCLYTGSCLTIAFSTIEIAWILYPAVIILAVSGFMLFSTNMQTANLIPTARGTILNLLNGALIASLGVMTFVKAAYQDGISTKDVFLFLACIGILMLFRTFFLMPVKIIPYDVPENFYFGIKEICNTSNKIPEAEHLLDEPEVADGNDVKVPQKSLKSSMLTSIYILGIFTSVMQQFRISFFIEELNTWLEYMMPNNKLGVSFYISLFGYFQFTGLVFAPLNGLLFDLLTKYYRKKSTLDPEQIKYRVLSIVCGISCSAAVLCAAFILIPLPRLQYATFILSVISNAYTMANISALIIQCFPMEQFGRLYGFMCFMSAIVSSLQFPFYYIGVHYFHNNFMVVNSVLLAVIILTLAHPINLYRLSKKQPEVVEHVELKP